MVLTVGSPAYIDTELKTALVCICDGFFFFINNSWFLPFLDDVCCTQNLRVLGDLFFRHVKLWIEWQWLLLWAVSFFISKKLSLIAYLFKLCPWSSAWTVFIEKRARCIILSFDATVYLQNKAWTPETKKIVIYNPTYAFNKQLPEFRKLLSCSIVTLEGGDGGFGYIVCAFVFCCILFLVFIHSEICMNSSDILHAACFPCGRHCKNHGFRYGGRDKQGNHLECIRFITFSLYLFFFPFEIHHLSEVLILHLMRMFLLLLWWN